MHVIIAHVIFGCVLSGVPFFFPKEREEGIHWLRRPCWSEKHSLLHLGFAATSLAGILPSDILVIFHIPFRSIISHGWFNPEIVDPRRGDFCLLQANKMAVLWVIPTCVALPAGPWDASGNWRPWKPWSFYRWLTYKEVTFLNKVVAKPWISRG